MKIDEGLFDHMVVQRRTAHAGEIAVRGVCGAAGAVEARVLKQGRALRGHGWRAAGRARAGRFQAAVADLAVGGPYRIEWRIRDAAGRAVEALAVDDVLVGDVWIAAGQSNMFGCGRGPLALPPVDAVRAFYMNDTWAAAQDPIHNMWAAVDAVHAEICGGALPAEPDIRQIGVGPAVAFGQEMQRRTGVPQGLLACAHGGTAMRQWNPALKHLAGGSLYGAALRRVRRNGGRVAGVFWYQGESDADPEAATHYTRRMQDMVKAFRRDTRAPRLPFVVVQISRVLGGWSAQAWNSIQDQQRRLPESIRHLDVVPAIDLELEDMIHIAGRDQHRLGRRAAEAMLRLTGHRPSAPPPMAVRKVSLLVPRGQLNADIVVEFDHVVGRLRADGRAAGFALERGEEQPLIYRVDLDGPRAVLRTASPPFNLSNLSLHYGFGLNPYCNLRDEADRAVPVFGPVPVTPPRALTGFHRFPLVSRLLEGAERLHALALPAAWETVGLIPRSFGTDFCDLHGELAPVAPGDAMVFYVFPFECEEPMRLAAYLGYDGPVKAWYRGRQAFHDPNGVNPAIPDTGSFRFRADAGRHEIVVALGANGGKAWGVFLRLERLDVPARMVAQGANGYKMPRISRVVTEGPARVPAG